MKAPFPYFGGKRDIASEVWSRLGRPKQYIEPFCGSAAVLLRAPEPASLEVIGDMNGFVANFWRSGPSLRRNPLLARHDDLVVQRSPLRRSEGLHPRVDSGRQSEVELHVIFRHRG